MTRESASEKGSTDKQVLDIIHNVRPFGPT